MVKGTVLHRYGKLKPIPVPEQTHDTLSQVYLYLCHALPTLGHSGDCCVGISHNCCIMHPCLLPGAACLPLRAHHKLKFHGLGITYDGQCTVADRQTQQI